MKVLYALKAQKPLTWINYFCELKSCLICFVDFTFDFSNSSLWGLTYCIPRFSENNLFWPTQWEPEIFVLSQELRIFWLKVLCRPLRKFSLVPQLSKTDLKIRVRVREGVKAFHSDINREKFSASANNVKQNWNSLIICLKTWVK